jgi:hypothetical protein
MQAASVGAAPGRLDLDVLVGCEQIGQLALPVGEQAGSVKDQPK